MNAESMVDIHPEVDLEWRSCSLLQLKKYLVIQKKGFRTCLNATLAAVHFEQTDRDLTLMSKFIKQCYQVFDRYARVCLKVKSGLLIPLSVSLKSEIVLYLTEIDKLFTEISKNSAKLVQKHKMYILIRIMCKSRLTLEKYLVHLNYWELSGNM